MQHAAAHPHFFNRRSLLSTYPRVAYLLQPSATTAVTPPPNTTMSDWKAPMTKLVNQIYSKADAGKSISRVQIGRLNFSRHKAFSWLRAGRAGGSRARIRHNAFELKWDGIYGGIPLDFK